MRRLARWVLLLLMIAAAIFLIWWTTRPEPVAVAVRQVDLGTVERTVANTRAGTIKACRRAKLSPSVGGQIAYLPVHKGDRVERDQVLLELWNDDLKAQAVLAEREAEAAQSRARAACLKAEVAQRNADRLVQLRKADVVSEERVENTVAEATALSAECDARRTETQVLAAKVAVARANIARTRLTAPFDGVIAEITGELFEFVTPSPIGIATPPVIDILENTCFYVAAPIDEVDAAGIAVGMPVRLTIDAFRGQRFQGRVQRIADYVLDIERQARTVEVEAAFDRPEDLEQLLAGYSADIEVILEVRRDVVRVPTEAVLEGRRVFVFRADPGRLEAREVRTGLSNWDWTEVTAGVSPGEWVVVNVDHPDVRDQAAARRLEERP
ncbi:efflux RND transporter periplasmic adaptor subunit [Desulfatitalea alkaliphila]|uniref:Efflux RND transporter periplasmic adaptor subunit n=1 Tax=Desulfatitalea alkaliphila TaxID=2929485 RepID=A0AA41R6W2_9BACT|nr:efflux RND transporter periplasmic adaptor subunit [Desulfatitalea alkaliphila]MCJ8502533.1 efflux RND transporter periplasmic adaptor subunit [Desulfatitalea alkaliphila]